ncbi:MAG: hypothetical protein HF973_10865 [Chloroflexi bacterium]|nr:hypothetical protein [Chloroflexota bacterium]
MELKESAIIEYSAKRLFPDLSRDQVLAQLLLERAQKNLIKYQSMARQFEKSMGRILPLSAGKFYNPNLHL